MATHDRHESEEPNFFEKSNQREPASERAEIEAKTVLRTNNNLNFYIIHLLQILTGFILFFHFSFSSFFFFLNSRFGASRQQRFRMDEVILFRVPGDSSHLLVLNLPYLFNDLQLFHLFSPYGLIHEAKVETRRNENNQNNDGNSEECSSPPPPPSHPPTQTLAPPLALLPSSLSSSSSSSSSSRPFSGVSSIGYTWGYVQFYSVYEATFAMKRLNGTALIDLPKPILDMNPDTATDGSNSSESSDSSFSSSSISSFVSNPRSFRSRLRICFLRRRHAPRIRSSHFPLSHQKCVQLANYFLNFNAYSCSVNWIRPFQPENDKWIESEKQHNNSQKTPIPSTSASAPAQQSSITYYSSSSSSSSCLSRSLPSSVFSSSSSSSSIRYRNSFTAEVSLSIRTSSTPFLSWGVGHPLPGERAFLAKKKAVSAAYQRLWHELAIIRLANGKVDVRQIAEVNTKGMEEEEEEETEERNSQHEEEKGKGKKRGRESEEKEESSSQDSDLELALSRFRSSSSFSSASSFASVPCRSQLQFSRSSFKDKNLVYLAMIQQFELQQRQQQETITTRTSQKIPTNNQKQ